jgi:hypothetical protein
MESADHTCGDAKKTKFRNYASPVKRNNPDWALIGAANSAEKRVQELRKRKRQLVEQNAPKEQVKAIDEWVTNLMVGLNQRVKELRQEAR